MGVGFTIKIQRGKQGATVARNFYQDGIKPITMDYTMLIVGVGYPVSIIAAYLIAVRMFASNPDDE
jgi:hypothetical protein